MAMPLNSALRFYKMNAYLVHDILNPFRARPIIMKPKNKALILKMQTAP
jgi:hypothetical protein